MWASLPLCGCSVCGQAGTAGCITQYFSWPTQAAHVCTRGHPCDRTLTAHPRLHPRREPPSFAFPPCLTLCACAPHSVLAVTLWRVVVLVDRVAVADALLFVDRLLLRAVAGAAPWRRLCLKVLQVAHLNSRPRLEVMLSSIKG